MSKKKANDNQESQSDSDEGLDEWLASLDVEQEKNDLGISQLKRRAVAGLNKTKEKVKIRQDEREQEVMVKALFNELMFMRVGDTKAPVEAVCNPIDEEAVRKLLEEAYYVANAKIREMKGQDEKEKERRELAKDLRAVQLLLKGDLKDQLHELEELEENVVVNYAKELNNLVDNLMMGYLMNRIDDDKYQLETMRHIEEGFINKERDSVRGRLGFTETTARLKLKLQGLGGVIDNDAIQHQEQKVKAIKLDLNEIGRENGKQLEEFLTASRKLARMIRIMKEKDKIKGRGDPPSEYWTLRNALNDMKYRAQGAGKAYVDINQILEEDQNWTENADGRVPSGEEKYQRLYDKVKLMISRMPTNSQKKSEVVLNTNTKGGKGKGKGGKGKGRATKAVCVNKLRKGYCDRIGCKFEGITRDEYEKLGKCYDDERNPGGCERKVCFFRHNSDVWEDKPCVHSNGRKSNANVVKPSAAAAEEEEGSSDENDS